MLKLKHVDRRSGLTPESFAREYLNTRKPVIFTDLMDAWPAKTKWTIDYFKKDHGDLQVPVYSANYSKPGKGYMTPDNVIPFREYLQMIEKGPADYRMFLFNLFRHAPELCSDFETPKIMDGFINSFPYMFFGGMGSTVALHFDIDLSHIFLNQFHGRKRVVMFPPEQSTNIYHHPFTVASYINVNNPDYDKHPALRKAWGYDCVVNHGETLFMPSGHWHYIEYLDCGFSVSQRANESYVRRARGLFNIARHFMVDKSMNKIMGDNWRKMKDDIARKRAQENILV